MKISHVIRGEDHLMNTAKHLELYEALGAEPPEFAHIPLILNKDGSKMSKRDQGAQVGAYRDDGFVSDAVINYLCLLGWNPKDDREKIPLDDVIALFDWDHLNNSNAKFDYEKCQWLNGQYLAEMAVDRFRDAALPFVEQAGLPTSDTGLLDAVLAPLREKVKLLSEVPRWVAFFFDDAYPFAEDAAEKAFAPEGVIELLRSLRGALEGLDPWGGASAFDLAKATAKDAGKKPGAIMQPCRVALTGQTFGAGLPEIMDVLGRERVLARLDRAIADFG